MTIHLSLESRLRLSDGNAIPYFGLGVFQMSDAEAESAVAEAVRAGYRLIDTAAIYGNEAATGRGIARGLADAGIGREELFVTTKLWNYRLNFDASIDACRRSLDKLGLDYVDLYLIHWPGLASFEANWKALEALQDQGLVKSIGVCNFLPHHFEALKRFASRMPVLNQIERHPKLTQDETAAYCREHGIALQAWSPLMQGAILKEPLVLELAKKYGRTPAQIVLRWDLQTDFIAVAKSKTPERIRSNARIFDFELSRDDVAALSAMNAGLRCGPNPETFDMNI